MNIAIPKESNPSVNVWSDFADVTLPLPDGVVTKECKYRISGTEDWNTVSNVEQADGKLVATITGLIPGTEYDFCFAINGVNGKITTATTELQKQLENGSLMNGIRMEKLGSRELRLRLLQRIRIGIPVMWEQLP